MKTVLKIVVGILVVWLGIYLYNGYQKKQWDEYLYNKMLYNLKIEALRAGQEIGDGLTLQDQRELDSLSYLILRYESNH
jgi:hypothetical protein